MKKKFRSDAIIRMIVKDDTDFLSVYSMTDTPVINSEVARFLEHSIRDMVNPDRLTLIIKSNCIDEVEKDLYRKAIAEYYSNCASSARRDYSRNRVIAWVLGGIGLLMLAAILAVDFPAIWSEVADIVAWVLLWESIDILLFRNHNLRWNLRSYEALAHMRVEYEEDRPEAEYSKVNT